MASEEGQLLVTGGSGLLGSEIKQLLPQADYPSSRVFNVTDYPRMEEYVCREHYTTLVHAAAFISPPQVEKDPLKAIEVNVVGTSNVVRLCMKHRIKLIYISTDYVFRGDKGNYAEEDELYPVNKYAWSKLGGECAVRLYDHALIVRTSFGPNIFPFEKAFIDQWTSRQTVKVIAKKIASLVETNLTGVIHLGGPRQTVMDYARGLNPGRELGAISIQEVTFKVPTDTSLNTTKYETLFRS
jgi:dTDP-4-dehydrorhamnose reductase